MNQEKQTIQEQNIRLNLIDEKATEGKLKKLCKIANQLNTELEKANSLISKLTNSKH